MILPGSARGRFIPSGFVLALVLRLLTSSLVIVVPLFVLDVLGVGVARVGIFVLILWVGNAVGVLIAVVAIARQSISSVAGFTMLAITTGGIALSRSGNAVIDLTLGAGVGMGMAQPFLSGLMHLDSSPCNPFEGLGYYSVALGLGLVIGPILASGLLRLNGFGDAFFALSLISLGGVAASVANRTRRVDESVHVRISPTLTIHAFRSRAFSYSFFANLMYAFTLPVYLSYGAVYAESGFGFTASETLIILSAVFAVSVTVRAVAVRLGYVLGRLLLVSLILLLGSLIMLGFAVSRSLLILGLLLFSVPHAFVFPITNFFALRSVDRETVMSASYAFQWSSGVTELLSPALAVGIIPYLGLNGLFLGMIPFGLVALLLASIVSTQGNAGATSYQKNGRQMGNSLPPSPSQRGTGGDGTQ